MKLVSLYWRKSLLSAKAVPSESTIWADLTINKSSGVSINLVLRTKEAVAYLLLLSESTSLKILSSASWINPFKIVSVKTLLDTSV